MLTVWLSVLRLSLPVAAYVSETRVGINRFTAHGQGQQCGRSRLAIAKESLEYLAFRLQLPYFRSCPFVTLDSGVAAVVSQSRREAWSTSRSARNFRISARAHSLRWTAVVGLYQ